MGQPGHLPLHWERPSRKFVRKCRQVVFIFGVDSYAKPGGFLILVLFYWWLIRAFRCDHRRRGRLQFIVQTELCMRCGAASQIVVFLVTALALHGLPTIDSELVYISPGFVHSCRRHSDAFIFADFDARLVHGDLHISCLPLQG